MQNDMRRKAYIAPDIILNLLIGRDGERVAELLKRNDIEVITHPFALYEAFAALDEIDRDTIDLKAFALLMSNTTLMANDLTQDVFKMSKERKKKLRELALSID
jgi:hypothetical protein